MVLRKLPKFMMPICQVYFTQFYKLLIPSNTKKKWPKFFPSFYVQHFARLLIRTDSEKCAQLWIVIELCAFIIRSFFSCGWIFFLNIIYLQQLSKKKCVEIPPKPAQNRRFIHRCLLLILITNFI